MPCQRSTRERRILRSSSTTTYRGQDWASSGPVDAGRPVARGRIPHPAAARLLRRGGAGKARPAPEPQRRGACRAPARSHRPSRAAGCQGSARRVARQPQGAAATPSCTKISVRCAPKACGDVDQPIFSSGSASCSTCASHGSTPLPIRRWKPPGDAAGVRAAARDAARRCPRDAGSTRPTPRSV